MNYFHVRATCNGATLAKLLNLTIFCNRTGKLEIHFQSKFLVFIFQKVTKMMTLIFPTLTEKKDEFAAQLSFFNYHFKGKWLLGVHGHCHWTLNHYHQNMH